MKELRKIIEETIATSMELTDKAFIDIGRNFCNLDNRINEGVRQTDIVIDDFKQSILKKDNSVFSLVNGLEKSIHTYISDFNRIEINSSKSLKSFKNNFQCIEMLKESIFEIRDLCELMEIMAINAMVVAIKSGKNGGGFTFISDSLRKNGSKMILLSDEMLVQSDNVNGLFNMTENDIILLTGIDQKINNFLENEVENIFKNIYISTQCFINLLDQVREISSGIQKPVSMIMQTLQSGDLIRQSLQDISRLVSFSLSLGKDKILVSLDQAVLDSRVCTFSIHVFEEIYKRLSGSVTLFDISAQAAFEIIEKTEQMLSNFVEDQRTNPESLSSICKQLKTYFEDIRNNLDSSATTSRKLLTDRQRLLFSIKKLQERTSEFEIMTSVLRNIILLGKIEISKIENLEIVLGSINEIEIITEKIDLNMTILLNGFDQIFKTDKETYLEYQHQQNDKAALILHMTDAFMNFIEAIDQVMNLFNNIISGYLNFKTDFENQIKAGRNDIVRLLDIALIINNAIDELKDIQKSLDSKLVDLLKSNDLNDHEIEDETLHSVLDSLTVLKHRQMALGMMGFSQILNSLEEGEVVLF